MALPQLACQASFERFLRTCASQVKRQHETEFIDMLQQVRYGENLDNVLRVLAEHCSTELSDVDGVDITRRLTSTTSSGWTTRFLRCPRRCSRPLTAAHVRRWGTAHFSPL
jgi:hypothetical protein